MLLSFFSFFLFFLVWYIRINFIERGKWGTMGPCSLALIRAQSRIDLMDYTLTLHNYTMRGLTCPIVGQTIKWVLERTNLWTDLHPWFATMENGSFEHGRCENLSSNLLLGERLDCKESCVFCVYVLPFFFFFSCTWTVTSHGFTVYVLFMH